MKTKLVYVVVSSENDIYLEQAYVSMYSAKYYMPDVHIVLLTDNHTKATLTGGRLEETRYADEIISIDLDKKYSSAQRSRILKSSVRKHVAGDFLFIDSDTIVVKPLDEIDEMKADIAACWDSHALFSENPYRDMCLEHGKLLGWPIEEEELYFNSGVIYVKDNQVAHDFYNLWSDNWLKGCAKGVDMDQPSFAQTNYMLNHPIVTLNDCWNCELKHGIKFLKDAKIVHYLCTSASAKGNKQLFILNEKDVFLEIKGSKGIIPPSVKKAIADPFKGLAAVTHTFAGSDVFFFRSKEYEYFYHYYQFRLFRRSFMVFLIPFRVASEIKQLLKRHFNI